MKNFLKILHIDEYSLTPYYRQLCNAILQGINDKLIDDNDVLPSINDLSIALDVSRNIVTKAYNTLKQSGVVSSVPGKGYFISNTNINRSIKVLLLFNKLSSPKKMIYDSFAESLGDSASIDFFIYNSSLSFLKKILADKIDRYDKIVIIPHFVDNGEEPFQVINQIPKEKLVLVGKLVDGVDGKFAAVYEDFENDIYNSLVELLPQVRLYTSLAIVFPKNSYYSTDILMGFLNFCKKYNCDYEIIPDLKNENISKNSLYITLTENDLVELVGKLLSNQLVLKEDIGIISYNETPLKKFILNGITTISADFDFMGKKAAEFVLSNMAEQIKVPFNTIVRPSI
jgi:DNA-binding transcriptional regulator YhcF (GntR family)